ncbi:MAG: LysM peptidoglycan-binding domain-containing protein [Halobacteriovoraceae bacterium]|nr:LysM peptidoglycan-binding domain-containing protein [Halobacteriovoraceae bacterium]
MIEVRPSSFYKIYEVQPGDTLSQIITDHFSYDDLPHSPNLNWSEINYLIDIVLHNNPHIKDPNRIQPWQMIDLATYKKKHSEIYTSAHHALMKSIFRHIPIGMSHIISRNQGSLDLFGLFVSGSVAASDSVIGQYLKAVKRFTDFVNNGGYKFKGSSNNLAAMLQDVWDKGPIKKEISAMNDLIIAQIKGLNYKGYINPLKKHLVFPNTFSPKKAILYTENAVKHLGKAKAASIGTGFMIESIIGLYKVSHAENNRVKVAFEQAGGILFGAAAAKFAAYGVCTYSLRLYTASTSSFVCEFGVSFIAGALGSYTGGLLGGGTSDLIYKPDEPVTKDKLY